MGGASGTRSKPQEYECIRTHRATTATSSRTKLIATEEDMNTVANGPLASWRMVLASTVHTEVEFPQKTTTVLQLVIKLNRNFLSNTSVHCVYNSAYL